MCSLDFKALERPWIEEFKRYFLGHFVDNSDIFTAAILVQEETKIHQQLFPFLTRPACKFFLFPILIIFLSHSCVFAP